MEDKERQLLLKIIHQLIGLVIFLLSAGILLALILLLKVPKLDIKKQKHGKQTITENTTNELKDTLTYWRAPDEKSLAEHANKEFINYGKNLIIHTADYFGSQGKVSKNSTNGMNCQNCHLEAGTKVFGNNYSAVAATYPKYRARSGTVEDIYKRINDCFERSLNGKALPVDSKEMKAIAAYILWLGKDVPKKEKPAGSGLKELAFLDRAADPEKGKTVYKTQCMKCHQSNGEGQWNETKTAFIYPPLWGPKSYTMGAGLYRLSNFARFVKYNMPQGVQHNSSLLTDEEAWDVAAYVNSQKRPPMDISKDWPKLNEKPFDHPFGPYADGFDEIQHKFGPFKPIQEKLITLQH